MSFNKMGGRFKRKSLLQKEEEIIIFREKFDKLKSIKLINHY